MIYGYITVTYDRLFRFLYHIKRDRVHNFRCTVTSPYAEYRTDVRISKSPFKVLYQFIQGTALGTYIFSFNRDKTTFLKAFQSRINLPSAWQRGRRDDCYLISFRKEISFRSAFIVIISYDLAFRINAFVNVFLYSGAVSALLCGIININIKQLT